VGATVEELGRDVFVSVHCVLRLNSDSMRASKGSGVNRQVKLAVRCVVTGVAGRSH
jgi:hypothetical protein